MINSLEQRQRLAIRAAVGAGATLDAWALWIESTAFCDIEVKVVATGTPIGTLKNVTGAVTANESGPGGTATAQITVTPLPVIKPPAIIKSFTPPAGPFYPGGGQTAGLSISITNPNRPKCLGRLSFG